LYERKKIPTSLDNIQNILDNSVNYIEEKLSVGIIKSAFEIKDIPELHDRLIAGTARYLNLPLITNDPVILESKYIKCLK
jgi:predicted nucleic acid-binding protein